MSATITDAALEQAREVFLRSLGQHPPEDLPALVAGGRAALANPEGLTETDRKILRYLDGAYGSRALWRDEPQTWEDTVGASREERERLAQLQQDIAAKLAAMDAARAAYRAPEIESRRRSRLLERAPYDHDRGRVMLPPGENPDDFTPAAFEALSHLFKRREKDYQRVREEYEVALGSLSAYKTRLQEQWMARRSRENW